MDTRIPGTSRHEADAPCPLVMRESIRARCALTHPALGGLAVITAMAALSLSEDVPLARLAVWCGPLMLIVAWRMRLAAAISSRLDDLSDAELPARDESLRRGSIVDQFTAGTGMWSVAQGGLHEVALFVTLAITLYAVGAMINLTSDYRGFRVALPMTMGQAALYWMLEGGHCWGIAATLVLLSVLMLATVRHSSAGFERALRMRRANAQLLGEVQAERARVQAALDEARAANQAKSFFLAAASHDLRQPLYAISLLADTLATRAADDVGRDLVHRQRQAIGILRALFDNLLDLSRFEAGRVVPAPVPLPLSEILDPLAAQFSALAAEKSLHWRFESTQVHVSADPSLIQRLLSNLLSNAVRYTDQGEIALRARTAGDRVEICISDSGPGIPAAEQDRAYQEFVQLSSDPGRRSQGLGLGLAIARRISDATDARLQLRSESGQGCRFGISLPLASEPAHAPRSTEVTAPGPMTVWVAEDDPLVACALARQMDAWRLACRVVGSAREIRGLVCSGEALPDAVILDDILGPGETGLELAQWLCGHLPCDRILIVSANHAQSRADLIRSAGFEFFAKPVAAAHLATWLSEVGRRAESCAGV